MKEFHGVITIRRNKETLLFIVIGIILFFSVANKNEFASAITFMYIPVAIAFIYFLLFDRHIKEVRSFQIPIVLVFFFSTASTLFSDMHYDSLFITIGASFAWCALFLLLTSFRYSAFELRGILNLYTFISFLFALYAIYCLANGIVDGKYGRIQIMILGTRKDPNFFSSFLTPAFAYSLYRTLMIKRNRLLFCIFSCSLFGAVFATGSRAAFLTIFFVTVIVIITFLSHTQASIKKAMLFILALCLILLAYNIISETTLFQRISNTNDYSSDIRLKLWVASLQAFLDHPFLGAGRGSANYYANSMVGNYAHNTFLEIICDQGIIGILLFTVAFLYILRTKKENRAFVRMMLVGFFLPLFFVSAYQSFSFWFPLAFCSSLSEYLKQNSIESLFAYDSETECWN